MNSFGLDELNTSRLMSILESHSCVSKAVIFGSRARNTFKVTSDIDIAIWTDLNSGSLSLSSNVISSLKADFEDSLIPYTVDLIDYQQLSNQRLKEEIDCYGKVFYLRGWVETSLGEVYEFASGLSKGREEFGFGFEFLTFKDVFQNYFLPDSLTSLANTTEQERINCSIKRGDVFLTRTSETQEELGMSSVALKDYPNATFNGFTKRLRPKNSLIICPEFIGYYFRSQKFRATITTMASMTTRASLNNSTLEILPILLPPFPEQKAIAAVLSSLDDKTELLREQNKTLETIAQVLFKEWFIDFNFPDENGEPYKKSGGKMVDSELGEIPEGWRVKSVSEIIAITDGTHDSPKQVEQGYPLITSKHINKDSIDIKNAYLISKTDFDDINRRSKVEQFDILISMIGTVGLIMPILSDQIDFAIKNVGLFRTSAKLEFFEYILLTLKSSSGSNYIQQNQSGTTQKYLTLGGLRDFTIFEPSYCLLQRFHSCTNSLYLKLKLNLEEIEELSNTRDKLLPKLMKGEIRLRK